MRKVAEPKKVETPLNIVTFNVLYPYDRNNETSIINVREEIRNEHCEKHLKINYSVNKILKTNVCLFLNYSNISCGVFQLHGISNMEYVFKSIDEIHTKEFKNIVKDIIFNLKEDLFLAFLICSNNTNTPLTNAFLDEICLSQTKYLSNPNMDNTTDIKVWVL